MPGPCLVVLGLAVCLTNCKAIEEVPVMLEVLPGPAAFCSSLPGKAYQILSVLICHLLLHSSFSDWLRVAGEHGKPLGKQQPVLTSLS